MIGLSGLITPSLEEMAHVASEMERLNFDLPLLIGGATTSKVHTAIKIAPHYHAPVVHVKDASRCVNVAGQLFSSENKDKFVKETRREFEELRTQYAASKSKTTYVSLEEARANKLQVDWQCTSIYRPRQTGIIRLNEYPLQEISEYISWVFFFIVWQIKGKYPDLLQDPVKGKEATRLLEDARNLLDEIIRKKLLTANGVVGIFPANSVGDDIEVYSDEKRSEVLAVFRNLRNQAKKEDGLPNLCLSDFVAPRENGMVDYLGAFAVTAGIGIEDMLKKFQEDHDDYNSIMVKALADRLAEAFTELVHKRVRKEFWGYLPGENLGLDDLLLEHYQGIRPAHGYPACPDHSEKETLFRLLDVERSAGIILTDSFAMYPAASVSGLIFAHPASQYFFVDRISKDQVEDYARRKGTTVDIVEKMLASNLNYKM
jgi:5-methyltetrahydrofolate--homocysteine methyltransferase